jgi:hydroxymethylbilane synthase
MKIRLAARASALSRAQVEIVARALSGRAQVEVATYQTTGDRLSHLDAAIQGKGVFTREIDEALLNGRADVGIHSLKDLPSEIPQGLVLAAVPVREDPNDALIAHPHRTFAALPEGARIGTGSPRRRAQLLAARPDLQVMDARGNVDTRIRRLAEGRWDAIVLARAGLARLNRLEEISEVFSSGILLPAVGQGALALVIRRGDDRVAGILAGLDDPASHRAALAERTLLRFLQAGCRAPLAGLATEKDGRLKLSAGVFSQGGDRILREEGSGPAEDPESLGRAVAENLLARGAAELIEQARA